MSDPPRYITAREHEDVFVCGHLDSRGNIDTSDGCCELGSDEWQCVHDFIKARDSRYFPCDSLENPLVAGLHTQVHRLLPYEIDAIRFTDWVESEVWDRYGEEAHRPFGDLVNARHADKNATSDLAKKLTEVFSEWLQSPGGLFQWVYDSEPCSDAEPVDQDWIKDILDLGDSDHDDDTGDFDSTLIGASHD